jgi:hypothetical protein
MGGRRDRGTGKGRDGEMGGDGETSLCDYILTTLNYHSYLTHIHSSGSQIHFHHWQVEHVEQKYEDRGGSDGIVPVCLELGLGRLCRKQEHGRGKWGWRRWCNTVQEGGEREREDMLPIHHTQEMHQVAMFCFSISSYTTL